jgi:hypothetical protein
MDFEPALAVAHTTPTIDSLPEDEWISAQQAIGWLAFNNSDAPAIARRELLKAQTSGQINLHQEGCSAEGVGVLGCIDRLGKTADTIVGHIRAGRLSPFVTTSDYLKKHELPSFHFTEGMTINVFDGRVGRPNEAPEIAQRASNGLKMAGLVGTIWFRRSEVMGLSPRAFTPVTSPEPPAPLASPKSAAQDVADEWMLERALASINDAGAKAKREPSIKECMSQTGVTWRMAEDAWNALPGELKRDRRENDRARADRAASARCSMIT